MNFMGIKCIVEIAVVREKMISTETVRSGAVYENAIPILRIGCSSGYREGEREWGDTRVGGLHEVNRP